MAVDLYRSFIKVIESNKSAHDGHRMNDAVYEAQCKNLKTKINACTGKQLTEDQAKQLIDMM
jgi:hypothetical protein